MINQPKNYPVPFPTSLNPAGNATAWTGRERKMPCG